MEGENISAIVQKEGSYEKKGVAMQTERVGTLSKKEDGEQ
jgi:hypothetical protein